MKNKTIMGAILGALLLLTSAAQASPPCLTNLFVSVETGWKLTCATTNSSIWWTPPNMIGGLGLLSANATCTNAVMICVEQNGDCNRTETTACATVQWQCTPTCDPQQGLHAFTIQIPPGAKGLCFSLFLTPDAVCSVSLGCVWWTMCPSLPPCY